MSASGPKNAVVRTSTGPRLLYAQESPEGWIEDFGEARLEKGRAYVELDPLFLETVVIDAAHPMKVFAQPNGDCQGVLVHRGTAGFEMVELGGGQSNAAITYRIVAKSRVLADRRLDAFPPAYNDAWLYPERAHEGFRASLPGAE